MSITSSGIPVVLKWTATDDASGVKNYKLQKSVDGGAYTAVGSAVTTPQTTVTLPAGHAYQFRVQATDNANNVSAFSSGAVFHVNLFQENAGAVTYTAGWTRVTQSGSSGGFVKYATVNAKKATFAFSGKFVGFVSTKASNRGSANVVYDATPATLVNTNNSATLAGRIVYVHGVTSGTHHLVVTALGTAGHPRVDVDAFVTLS
jgi:hypothetical protein